MPGDGSLILAGPSATLAHLQSRAKAMGANDLFVNTMAPASYRAGVHAGVDPTVLIAQSFHETGGGKFGRAVTPAHKNVAGLKITRPVGPDTNPKDHATFATWDDGALAHAHHLLAYASAPLPEGDTDLSPRSIWVRPQKHGFTRIRQLGGYYAPSPQYGERVEAVAKRLLEGA